MICACVLDKYYNDWCMMLPSTRVTPMYSSILQYWNTLSDDHYTCICCIQYMKKYSAQEFRNYGSDQALSYVSSDSRVTRIVYILLFKFGPDCNLMEDEVSVKKIKLVTDESYSLMIVAVNSNKMTLSRKAKSCEILHARTRALFMVWWILKHSAVTPFQPKWVAENRRTLYKHTNFILLQRFNYTNLKWVEYVVI